MLTRCLGGRGSEGSSLSSASMYRARFYISSADCVEAQNMLTSTPTTEHVESLTTSLSRVLPALKVPLVIVDHHTLNNPSICDPTSPSQPIGRPARTRTPTCIWWSLAMLQTQVAAYLLHSPSPSDVNLTAAWSPPPRVAADRVSALAVRLHSVITARRLQSTSGQDVSLMRDAGQPDSAMTSFFLGVGIETKCRPGRPAGGRARGNT